MVTYNARMLLASIFQRNGYLSSNPVVYLYNQSGSSVGVPFGRFGWPSENGINYLPYQEGVTTGSGVRVGSGSTAPAKNNYRLESEIETTSGAVTAERGYSNNRPYLRLTVSVTNTGTEAITVREIGYFQTFDGNGYMLDRTLLSTPLTIAAGGTGQIVYTISGIWESQSGGEA